MDATESNMPVPAVVQRLHKRSGLLSEVTGIDEPPELEALLQDIQTLLYRCGYHVRLTHLQRHSKVALPVARSQDTNAILPRRGRPPGTANWASHQLALGLAMTWFEYTGRVPVRRVDGYHGGREHGPYYDFVTAILSGLPRVLRATRKGHVPAIDHVVRQGIDAFKIARAHPDEARQRGLLDPACWA